jgi:pilus assembly protein CpaF
MFAIIIQEKGGEPRRMSFNKAEVTIGRVQGNDIVLPKGNVSKRHARIVLKDGKFIIVDLKSTNGTYVNGRKITSPLVVKDSDKIYIGDFIVGVDENSVGVEMLPAVGSARSAGNGEAEGAYAAPAVHVPPPAAPVPQAVPQQFSASASAPQPRSAPPRAPAAPVPAPVSAREPVPAAAKPAARPVPSPTLPPMVPPAPAPAPAAPAVEPAPAASRSRLVGAGAGTPRRSQPRTVAPQLRRGVQLDPLDAKTIKLLDLQAIILERLRAKLDLSQVPVERLGDEDLWQRAERAIVDLVAGLESSGDLPKYIEQDTLIKETLNEALGLGPLEDLLGDANVDEIIVDRRDRVIVGKDRQLRGSGKAFSSDEVLRNVIQRLVAPTGHNVDLGQPLVDVRLRDGARLSAAVPPVATSACLVLRKPRSAAHGLPDLVAHGALSAAMVDFLLTCIAARRNILVSGAAGSGKTLILGALAQSCPPGERLVSVEEVGELALHRDEWVSLETWNGDGQRPAVTLRDLIATAFRLAPDRLVVGEVRGAEALELVSGLASSHDGAVAGVTADSTSGALSRVALLTRLAGGSGGQQLADGAARDLVAAGFDIGVHVVRNVDGTCRVQAIDEVIGATDGGFETQTLFQFQGSSHVPTGVVPRFYAELDGRGISADASIFK